MLQVEGIESHYGSSQALFGLSFDVEEREVVTLVGRNGMGKSTIVKAITGLLAPTKGTVRLGGTDITGKASYQVARAGIGLVPEGRRMFPNLSVRENLLATAANRRAIRQPWDITRAYGLFPRLKERERNLGSNLSGGEQQMLAIARALRSEAFLDREISGEGRLALDGDRVHIRSAAHRLPADGGVARAAREHVHDLAHALGSGGLQHGGQRLLPLEAFLGVGIGFEAGTETVVNRRVAHRVVSSSQPM